MLDSEGLSKLAEGNGDVRAIVAKGLRQGYRIVLAAVTLAEVVRGDARDANINRTVSASGEVVPVTAEISREAGKLLRLAGLDGRCTIDAIVVTVAARQTRPVVILTSDPNDINALISGLGLPKNEITATPV
ncbi:PIN domain-containing protein [Kitasatospora sp. NPDC090091]|uniref:PIN domain-containing protein n=1 Tax=Kitasatospora sp. NPDC090091 TaxID=3364081 RepID=UPI0038214F85